MSTYLVCTLCVVGGILLGVLAYGLINMAAENEKARRQTEVLLKEKEELEEISISIFSFRRTKFLKVLLTTFI